MFDALRALTLPFLVALSGCGPEPVYNDDLDLQAAATAPGELAGTFALFTRAIGPVTTPFGEAPSGNDDWMRVERTFDPVQQRYHQSVQLCGGDYIPVLETKTVIPLPTWRAVPPSTEEILDVDHGRGVFSTKEHLQLWALQDLDDPLHTPLPTTFDEATAEPFLQKVYDLDDDGNPGVTFATEGLIVGEVYAAQRKTSSLDGVVLSADRIAGISDHLYEFVTVGASISLLETQPQFNDTDERQSWFEQVRLDDGAGCDEVQALVDDGTIGERPF